MRKWKRSWKWENEKGAAFCKAGNEIIDNRVNDGLEKLTCRNLIKHGIYYKFRNICVVLPWYMNEEHALALLVVNIMYWVYPKVISRSHVTFSIQVASVEKLPSA